MKFNRDLAIKGALVVAILIVIGVSAHLYAKKKREHFDFEMNSLKAFSKGASGEDGEDGEDGVDGVEGKKGEKGEKGSVGASAFNIAVAEKRWTGAVDNRPGWLNSLIGEPGLTGAAGKNWNDLPGGGVTAAAGGKVNVTDIVDYIITKVKEGKNVHSLGTIMAYHIGFKPNDKFDKIGVELLEKGWVICDGRYYSDKDGNRITAPDLRGRFLYQQKDLENEVQKFETGMGESEHSDGDVASGKIQINAKQMPRHRHITLQTRRQQWKTGFGRYDPEPRMGWRFDNDDLVKKMRGHGSGAPVLDETILRDASKEPTEDKEAIQMSYYSGGDREKGGIYTAGDATEDKKIYPVDGDKTYKLDKTKGDAIDIRPPYFSVIYIMKVA
jgi:hypothetical protein